MENIIFNDIEPVSNSNHIFVEKETCILEESDKQCGHIFYNEFTRLLKFYCTYCRETYDNIDYFCHHLSDHINGFNEENSDDDIEPKGFKEAEEEIESYAGIEDSEDMSLILPNNIGEVNENSHYSLQSNDEDTRDAFEYEQKLEEMSLTTNDKTGNEQTVNLHNDGMIIEEIEYAEEILAEVEQEMLEQMEGDINNFIPKDSSSKEVINYDENYVSTEKSVAPLDNPKNGNSFEECFIKETNIDKIRSEGVCVLKEKILKDRKPVPRKRSNIQDLLRSKLRRKKVTTVKVIAVKNRIAELYEKIQNEQQKSQQILSNDFVNTQQEQETQDATEILAKDEEIVTNDKTNPSTAEVTRKIIGETLITLIPEGTKIPNKMPSPVNSLTNKEFTNKEQQLTTTNTHNYKHYKAEDNKEKIAVCPACGKTFRSHFSLTIHKRIHYLESDSSVKLAHKCSDCDQLFNKLSQLKDHVETVHYPEGFICKICNRQLSSLSLLERHMVKVHLDRPFNCKKCNKNFSDPLTFEEHLASHNSGEVFKCSTCGRKYSTEYFLLEHMRNHKEQLPQTCVVCGKITLRITQHMKIHTPRPKRLLSCSECGKVFNFSSGLSHHFKIMHKLPRPPPKPKKETHSNTYKRKLRRSRTNECSTTKSKILSNFNPTDPTFNFDNEKFPDQTIEEQIEIPHEVYGTTAHTAIINLKRNENPTEQTLLQRSSHAYSLSNSREQNQSIMRNFQQDDAINHKEEEAKRVIVELIQNSTYTSFFPDNFPTVLEVAPPIAREETISAINSIVHDC